ncbi:MAG: TlpA family protein disulfide reductase [Fimbriimonadales bacterium]
MRLAAILVTLGVAFAAAGGIMTYVALEPKSGAPANSVPEVRHPVSSQMLLEASRMSERASPLFKLEDAHGIPVQLGGSGAKPQFVYFILEGCPCSLDAQPLFNALYRRYKDKVDFIGVINAGKATALDYAGQTTTLHPIVCDPDLRLIRAFGVKQSTYNLIVRSDGLVDHMWPGYSRDILRQINARLAKLTGTPETPFDASVAPETPASGCYF